VRSEECGRASDGLEEGGALPQRAAGRRGHGGLDGPEPWVTAHDGRSSPSSPPAPPRAEGAPHPPRREGGSHADYCLMRASISAIVRGAPAERTSAPARVTRTSSSIRTPMFHHFGSTSSAGAM